MLDEERSIDTNPGSDVDDDGPTLTARGEDREIGPDAASAMSLAPTPSAGGRRRGRPSKLTRQTQDKIRAGVAAGLPVEVAARSAGIAPSTVYEWRQIGAQALATRSDDRVLSDRERACLEFEILLRQAEAEHLAGLQAMVAKVATNRRKTKTTLSMTYKVVRDDVLRDEHGEPLWIPTYTSEVTDEPDVPALLAMYNHAYARASQSDRSEPRTDPADDARDLAGFSALEMRLADSIRVRREELQEEADDVAEQRVDRRPQAAGVTTPTSTVAASDDDDDYYYAYELCESYLYEDVAPETPETPESP